MKINLTEIGSEVDSSGSGYGIMTYAFEQCNKFWVPGEANFFKIFATQGRRLLNKFNRNRE